MRVKPLECPACSSTTCAVLGCATCDRAGVSRHIAMGISGHKTKSMYQRYNIVREADLRAAAEKT